MQYFSFFMQNVCDAKTNAFEKKNLQGKDFFATIFNIF